MKLHSFRQEPKFIDGSRVGKEFFFPKEGSLLSSKRFYRLFPHMEKLVRDFLWDGFDGHKKRHSVGWDVCCLPKSKCGLAIGEMA